MAGEWWQRGTIYQIYPRSFMDSNGDGIGDLDGICQRLDYLKNILGVDAIWLSPVQRSPQRDFGYDISNYCEIDPIFGDLAAMESLVAACRHCELKVIMDGVYNHTSDQHPWFLASRSSEHNPKRDWYVWHDGPRPPNNWGSVFGGSAWTQDSSTGHWYLHSFLPTQPDLNWRNPEVVEAVLDTMQFWYQRGVSGFRLDVFNTYFKHEELRSNPRRRDFIGLLAGVIYPFLGQEHVYDRDQPEMHGVLKRMRALSNQWPDGFLVGETLDERFEYKKAGHYVGPSKLHMAFDFKLLHSSWGANQFRSAIERTINGLPPNAWPAWVLSNHDFSRHASRWGGRHSDERAKLLALMVCTLKGTPFFYYGEELGLKDTHLRRREIQDPPGRRFWPFFKGRDGSRTPMPWTAGIQAGFTTGQPWLPLGDDAHHRNVETQLQTSTSVLNTYVKCIALRKMHSALHSGDMCMESLGGRLLSWTRSHGEKTMRIVLNMCAKPTTWPYRGNGSGNTLVFSTSAALNGECNAPLAPYEGRVVAI